MQQLINNLYSDLSTILLNSSLDTTLNNILDFLISCFSYMSYLIIIIYLFAVIKDMFKFMFLGGFKKCKIF